MNVCSQLGAKGIRVNAILPGPILPGPPPPLLPPLSVNHPSPPGMLPEEMIPKVAPLSPFNRIGTADEVAGVCVALVSEDCAWVCGQCIGVDGAGFLG